MYTIEQELNFVKLDQRNLFIGVFIEAAFANKLDLSSQLGFLTTLMDDSSNCNRIHYSSIKCKSALSSELFLFKQRNHCKVL